MEFNYTYDIPINTDGPVHDNPGYMHYILVSNYVLIGNLLGLFGIVTNVINMTVFAKIGFKDTINVSLFGLSFSDFGACLTVLFWNLALNPWFNTLELSFYPVQVLYLVAGWPRNLFTKTTTIITAFITFERCLCVSMPLKVKSIITTKRVKTIVTLIYVLVVACYIPLYYANRLSWRFDATRNKSILGLAFTDDRDEIESVVFTLQNVLFSFCAFVFIIICTAILVVNLKRKRQWRKTVTTSTDQVSSKETRVVKMVVFLATLLIVCFTPTILLVFTMTFDHSMSITGSNANLLLAFASVTFIFESINSGVNIFIYYSNSSIYRKTFRQLLQLQTWRNTNIEESK